MAFISLRNLFDAIRGTYNGEANKVQVTGSSLAEQQNEGHAVVGVHTFAANIQAVEIYHSETYSQPFWANGLQIYVPSGGWRSSVGGTPDTKVTALTTGFEYTIGRVA